MRTCVLFLCGLFLLLVIGLPTMAKAPKPAVPKSAIKGEWAVMVKECSLTADQQTKLEEKVKAMNAALTDWDTRHKEQLTKLNADIKAAKDAKDQEKLRGLRQQLKMLQADRNGLQQQHRKGILNLLTPEQRQTWAVYNIQLDVTRRFAKVKLTDDQRAKIKTLCEATLAEMDKLPADQQKARTALKTKLYSTVEQQVLTDEQRAQLHAKPAPKGTREQPK